MDEEYIKIWSTEVFFTIGYKTDVGWQKSGLRFIKHIVDPDTHLSFVVYRIMDKDKFLWTCIKHSLKYESFNAYRNFVVSTTSRTQ